MVEDMPSDSYSASATRRSDSQAPPLRGLRILVVDDVADNLHLITRILRLAGAMVDVAENGLEGVKKSESQLFDMVLMDIQMPVMDGYQATLTMRENGFAKPIIALTAHAMKEERERCLSLGFSDHIAKPVDRAFLVQRLSEFKNQSN